MHNGHRSLLLILFLHCAAASDATAQPGIYERFILGATHTAWKDTSPGDLATITQMDSMSFNYWYTSAVGEIHPDCLPQFEAAAESMGAYLRVSGLDVAPGIGFWGLGKAWDFRIEAEDELVSRVVNGTVQGGAVRIDQCPTPSGPPCTVIETPTDLVPGGHLSPPDILWSRYREPGAAQHRAYVTFRLRWEASEPPGADTPVARIGARHSPSHSPPSYVTETLLAGEFACQPPGSCYKDFEVELTPGSRGGGLGAGWLWYRVEYLGEGTLYVDRVHVDTPFAREVLGGAYDEALRDAFEPFDTPVYPEFVSSDEPHAFEGRALAHLDDVLSAAYGKRAVVNLYLGDYDTVAYLTDLLDAPRLMGDAYVIGRRVWGSGNCSINDGSSVLMNPDLPGGDAWGVPPYDPSTYQAELQIQLDCLTSRLQHAIDVADGAGIPFWYVPQAHGTFSAARSGDGWTGRWTGLRPVSAAEARLVTYLGIAYGAKGIVYHLYKTMLPGDRADINVGMVSNGSRVGGGAVEPVNGHASDYDRDLVPGDSVYTGYNRLWEAFRRVNLELAAAGPTLTRLNHTVTYNSSDGHPCASPISAITESLPGSGSVGAGHVQVGVLDDPAGDARYVVLVNRMARPTDERALTITLRPPHDARVVLDVATGETVAQLAAGASTFGLTMTPGDGRILKIVP